MTKLNYHNNKDVLQLVRNIEGNRDIVENILDLLNANKSIRMTPTRCNIYLCRWNEDEIVQIHTIETLYNEYKDTNLFDDKVYFDNNNLKYDFRNWGEVLKEWQVKKYDFATTLKDDNFEITLIKGGQ